MIKSYSFAIAALSVAMAVSFTSCSDDDPIVDANAPTMTHWTEPYHIPGASVEEVKAFMSAYMPSHTLAGEYSGAVNPQLTYSSNPSSTGVVYSFTKHDGALYSVIDTELNVNQEIVLKYLNDHYTLVPGSGNVASNIQFIFTTADKSTVINTVKVSDQCFNVSYSFVTK